VSITTTEVASALELTEITAGYGRTTVLRDVSITVPRGSVVALLGPNGAGKTTLLRTAGGLMRPSSGRVAGDGHDLTRRHAYQRAKAGVCLIPEGRGVFPNLSVRENLLLQIPPWVSGSSFDAAIDAFPVLGERLAQRAGSLSGGQQQMLALARCFLSEPSVVLLDEVSMGLAPRVVDEIFAALQKLADSGVALLLVEQYVTRALEMADHVYLLDRGQTVFSGPAAELDADEVLRRYLHVDAADVNGNAAPVDSRPSTAPSDTTPGVPGTP
jgi:branched-chain amino acid transport system ATP-binding protein